MRELKKDPVASEIIKKYRTLQRKLSKYNKKYKDEVDEIWWQEVIMWNDCPECWSVNIIRIENQKAIAYCEDCGCWFNLLSGDVYEQKKH